MELRKFVMACERARVVALAVAGSLLVWWILSALPTELRAAPWTSLLPFQQNGPT
jgi:hypothetical protein